MNTPIQDTSFPAGWPRETGTTTAQPESVLAGSGWCRRCNASHDLPTGSARHQAEALLRYLEQTHSIILPGNHGFFDPSLSTTPLWGEDRGKMFGVLETCSTDGKQLWLYAFSGQYGGRWHVPGWAPPLFDITAFQRINEPRERLIKELGERIASLPAQAAGRCSLVSRRKALSRLSMLDIHTLYRVHNFRGESAPLSKAFSGSGGKPTGTGDCCAPKLLNQAAVLNLAPVSLAEFYFGRTNRSGSCRHGRFYPSCVNKCRPLLGFMLCGAKQKRERHGC